MSDQEQAIEAQTVRLINEICNILEGEQVVAKAAFIQALCRLLAQQCLLEAHMDPSVAPAHILTVQSELNRALIHQINLSRIAH